MPLTPADIQNVVFRKPSIGKRGFDAEEVDAFLDRVQAEFVRQIELNNELRALAGQGGAEVDDLRARLGRVQRQKEAAEEAARAIEAELEHARSRGGLAGDGEQAPRVLMMARRTADEHVADARREADGLLSDARTKAEKVRREAQDKARHLEEDAERRHQDALSGLDARRTAVRRDIEELEQFARSYRTRLKAYLNSQVRECEDGIPAPA